MRAEVVDFGFVSDVSCSLQEASPQRKSSSTPTGSVPVTPCALRSTGSQVGTESLQLLFSCPASLLTLMCFSGDPRRPYPTDLEMRSGMLGHMANLPTNGVNGHLPGDALAAGRLPGESVRRFRVTFGFNSLSGFCVTMQTLLTQHFFTKLD